MAGKRSAQSWPLRVKQRTRAPSRRHQPVAVMLDFVDPQRAGGWPRTFDGWHGSMKPEGRRTIMA